MTEEQQDFAQEPPLTDGEVKLLRLLLQRVASPDFDFGFCGPRTGGPEDFGPRAVSVSRSPLLTPADFRAAGVPRPEVPEDHFGDFVFWVVVGLFALWLFATFVVIVSPELAAFAGWLRNLFRRLLRRLVRATTFGRRGQ